MKPTTEFLLSREDAARIRTLVPAASIRRPSAARPLVATLLLVTLLLALLWFGFASAQTTAGTWKGVTEANDIVVTLILKTAEGDATLRFSAPRDCSLTARFELRKDATSRYSLRNSNGGYCDRLEGERMTLVSGADSSHLTLQLIDGKGTVRDTVAMVTSK